MNKAIIVSLALVLFFSTSANAAARCDVNEYDLVIGLEDCGVDHLDPDTNALIAEYLSMSDFYANAFPSILKDGDRLKYRVYIKNNLQVPALDNYITCALWQIDTVNNVYLKSFPYSENPKKLTLEAGETGQIDMLLEINSLVKLGGEGHKTQTSCSLSNGASARASGASAGGFELETTSQEIEVTDVEKLPEDNCPTELTELCLDIGDTIEITYVIKNLDSSPIGPFQFLASANYGTPITGKSSGGVCTFEGEGAIFLAATGEDGDEKTVYCTHTISFLEGKSVFYALATVSGNQTQVSKLYTVSGAAYHFKKLSPFSIYNSLADEISVEYDIQHEAGTLPQQLYFVAEVQEPGSSWEKISEWNYMWELPGEVQQPLTGYSLEDALKPGKKKLRIMAFDGEPPNPLPNPETSFAPNLFDWVKTSFYVPRIVQPGNKPYFPGGNIFNLTAGENKLGIRNLYDVSALDESIRYKLSLKEGNPDNVTITYIRCYEGSCPAPGPLPLIFTFSKRLPEKDFNGDGTPYGGTAPGLNAEIIAEINEIGTYEFLIDALDDVPGTDLIESTISEEFESKMLGASITQLTTEPTTAGNDATIHIEISEARKPTVKIFDAVTNQEETGATTEPVSATSQNVFYTTTREGSFKAEVTIELPCGICKKTSFFVVTKSQRAAVPETGLLAIALTALSVVAIIALKERKK